MIGRPLCECARDAAVPGRSLVDRRAAAAGVLRNMRRRVHRAQLVDEVFCVVGLSSPGLIAVGRSA